MLIVALTGGIATGKSVVAGIFKDLGCYIYHADRAAHLLSRPGQPAWNRIIDHFGPSILADDKTIDRKKLASLIFADRNERQFLNDILHPLVFQDRNEVIRRLRKERSHKIFINEAALTIEAGTLSSFDKIVVTDCQEELQIKRLIARDHLSREEALTRINSQLPTYKKIEFADYIIDTSKELSRTVEETERVFRSLSADFRLLYGHF